jgi:hypothetical protein
MKRYVNSIKILSLEDKKIIRSFSRYLNGLGMKEAEIEEYGYQLSEIDWSRVSIDGRNDIPDFFLPVIEKITNFVNGSYLYKKVMTDFDDSDGGDLRVSFIVDTVNKEVSLLMSYQTMHESDDSLAFDSEEDSDNFNEWINDGAFSEIDKNTKILVLKYDGGGDSGYLNDEFEDTDYQVPDEISSWCYNVLSNHFGGWEINEGSRGEFIFDLEKLEVTLEHKTRFYEDAVHTCYEESFE